VNKALNGCLQAAGRGRTAVVTSINETALSGNVYCIVESSSATTTSHSFLARRALLLLPLPLPVMGKSLTQISNLHFSSRLKSSKDKSQI